MSLLKLRSLELLLLGCISLEQLLALVHLLLFNQFFLHVSFHNPLKQLENLTFFWRLQGLLDENIGKKSVSVTMRGLSPQIPLSAHLHVNAFKYFCIKAYRTLNQFKNTRK